MAVEPEEKRRVQIERLQRQVAAGRYHVPADQVADAMIRFFSRDLPEPGSETTR